MDASHVYVRALALGCCYSHISTRTFRRALTASLDSCAEINGAAFSGVTKSGTVWRKVPENDARNVWCGVVWCGGSNRICAIASLCHRRNVTEFVPLPVGVKSP